MLVHRMVKKVKDSKVWAKINTKDGGPGSGIKGHTTAEEPTQARPAAKAEEPKSGEGKSFVSKEHAQAYINGAAKTASKLLGAGVKQGYTGFEWSKKGGYADVKMKLTRMKIEKAGFKEVDFDQADHPAGNWTRNTTIFQNENGDVIKMTSRYGETSRQNSHSVAYTPKDFNKAKERLYAQDSDPRGYKVSDQIIKGFMIYKMDKNPAQYTAKNENGEQYEGTLEEINKKIDAYWAERDAEVIRQKAAGIGYKGFDSKVKDAMSIEKYNGERKFLENQLSSTKKIGSPSEIKELIKRIQDLDDEYEKTKDTTISAGEHGRLADKLAQEMYGLNMLQLQGHQKSKINKIIEEKYGKTDYGNSLVKGKFNYDSKTKDSQIWSKDGIVVNEEEDTDGTYYTVINTKTGERVGDYDDEPSAIAAAKNELVWRKAMGDAKAKDYRGTTVEYKDYTIETYENMGRILTIISKGPYIKWKGELAEADLFDKSPDAFGASIAKAKKLIDSGQVKDAKTKDETKVFENWGGKLKVKDCIKSKFNFNGAR